MPRARPTALRKACRRQRLTICRGRSRAQVPGRGPSRSPSARSLWVRRIAATSPSLASAAEFTAVDLYHICTAGMEVHSDINHSQACFNFLGQVWGRGVVAGEIFSVNPVKNIQMAMTFTTGLWRLAPEYL